MGDAALLGLLIVLGAVAVTTLWFERAVDIRDAHLDGAMTTLDAVNEVLATAHTHIDWRRDARRAARRVTEADYRKLANRAVAVTAAAYDWLLRHLLGPFFSLRLRFLDAAERRRAARAQQRGDVFEAAWLSAHYCNERLRLAQHWDYLHNVRTPSAIGNGFVERPHSLREVAHSRAIRLVVLAAVRVRRRGLSLIPRCG